MDKTSLLFRNKYIDKMLEYIAVNKYISLPIDLKNKDVFQCFKIKLLSLILEIKKS